MQLASPQTWSRHVFAKYGRHAVRRAREFSDVLYLFRAGMRDGLALFARYQALSRLSDEGLAKRGLARGDIGRAVLDRTEPSTARHKPV